MTNIQVGGKMAAEEIIQHIEMRFGSPEMTADGWIILKSTAVTGTYTNDFENGQCTNCASNLDDPTLMMKQQKYASQHQQQTPQLLLQKGVGKESHLVTASIEPSAENFLRQQNLSLNIQFLKTGQDCIYQDENNINNDGTLIQSEATLSPGQVTVDDDNCYNKCQTGCHCQMQNADATTRQSFSRRQAAQEIFSQMSINQTYKTQQFDQRIRAHEYQQQQRQINAMQMQQQMVNMQNQMMCMNPNPFFDPTNKLQNFDDRPIVDNYQPFNFQNFNNRTVKSNGMEIPAPNVDVQPQQMSVMNEKMYYHMLPEQTMGYQQFHQKQPVMFSSLIQTDMNQHSDFTCADDSRDVCMPQQVDGDVGNDHYELQLKIPTDENSSVKQNDVSSKSTKHGSSLVKKSVKESILPQTQLNININLATPLCCPQGSQYKLNEQKLSKNPSNSTGQNKCITDKNQAVTDSSPHAAMQPTINASEECSTVKDGNQTSTAHIASQPVHSHNEKAPERQRPASRSSEISRCSMNHQEQQTCEHLAGKETPHCCLCYRKKIRRRRRSHSLHGKRHTKKKEEELQQCRIETQKSDTKLVMKTENIERFEGKEVSSEQQNFSTHLPPKNSDVVDLNQNDQNSIEKPIQPNPLNNAQHSLNNQTASNNSCRVQNITQPNTGNSAYCCTAPNTQPKKDTDSEPLVRKKSRETGLNISVQCSSKPSLQQTVAKYLNQPLLNPLQMKNKMNSVHKKGSCSHYINNCAFRECLVPQNCALLNSTEQNSAKYYNAVCGFTQNAKQAQALNLQDPDNKNYRYSQTIAALTETSPSENRSSFPLRQPSSNRGKMHSNVNRTNDTRSRQSQGRPPHGEKVESSK